MDTFNSRTKIESASSRDLSALMALSSPETVTLDGLLMHANDTPLVEFSFGSRFRYLVAFSSDSPTAIIAPRNSVVASNTAATFPLKNATRKAESAESAPEE
jgi:hypothetical protein